MKIDLRFMALLCGCLCMHQLVYMAEPPQEESSTQQAQPITSTIYIKNSSDFFARISVGPEYPNSIAIYPGQILEFPLMNVTEIHVSSYGKYSHYMGDLVTEVARLDVSASLQEHPEYRTKNCLINITCAKDSDGFAPYLGHCQWKLSFEQPDENQNNEPEDGNTVCVSDAVYDSLKQPAGRISDPVVRDAAFIWSIFPRVAAKIINKDSIYPFNILGLDIGDLAVTDKQLRNWGRLLYTTSQKRFPSIGNRDIWYGVSMIIADSVELMRSGNYYFTRDPNYLVTLFHIRCPVPDFIQRQDAGFTQKLIDKLKDTVQDNPVAKILVSRIEWEARIHGWDSADARSEQNLQAQQAPPPPPPPNPLSVAGSYQEKSIADFLRDFSQKRPEEQSILDNVVHAVFELIDGVGSEGKKNIQLKYAALDKLRFLAKSEQTCATNLSKVKQFMSRPMIRLASLDGNPVKALNDWISLVVSSDRQGAYDYSQKTEQELQGVMQKEAKLKDNQACLMKHLREQLEKYKEHE